MVMHRKERGKFKIMRGKNGNGEKFTLLNHRQQTLKSDIGNTMRDK